MTSEIEKAPIVSVAEGKLKGSVLELLDGNPYYSFKGIRYAQPPVGKLRFRAPIPIDPWDGIYDATKHGGVCPQMDITGAQKYIAGNEDCLFLNVYSRILENVRKPVIVFIHGGAFMGGSGDSNTFGPEYLLQHDVVLVTINYRLEVLGFLCLDIEEVPGNAGMKDQVLALKWVKNNISSFGGDPDNITIMGESAGAVSVTYHMVSPMSRNLFHKVIAQSGVCLNTWGQGVNSLDRAYRVANLLGKQTNDVYELLDFLQSVPAVDFAKAGTKTRIPEEKYEGLNIFFCPVVEKNFSNVEPFMNEESLNLLLAKKFQDVPMIIGYTSSEGIGTLKGFANYMDVYNRDLHYKVPRDVLNRISQAKLKDIVDRIRMFYFQGRELSEDLYNEMAQLDGDLFFKYDIHRFVDTILAAKAKAPIYMYRFACETEINIMKVFMGYTQLRGVSHADELNYLFSNEITIDTVRENNEIRKIVNVVTKLWTNFARTGNPTPDQSLGVQWIPISLRSQYMLNIDTTLSLIKNPEQESVDFWNKIYAEAGLLCNKKSNL